MAKPVTFDASAYVADLRASGCKVHIARSDRQGVSYIMEGPFRRAYSEVMRKWADALDECSDHAEQVGDYLQEECSING